MLLYKIDKKKAEILVRYSFCETSISALDSHNFKVKVKGIDFLIPHHGIDFQNEKKGSNQLFNLKKEEERKKNSTFPPPKKKYSFRTGF